MIKSWLILSAFILAGTSWAGEPTIRREPSQLRGIPGEPLKLVITVETDRATPIQLRIPSIQHLILRTVEKTPIQRTATGRYIQERTILGQGIEAGSTTVTNVTVVFQGLEKTDSKVPDRGKEQQALTQLVEKEKRALTQSVEIIIDPATPANPPKPAETDE